jgi:two-component system, NarL family, sensor histidine kinase UhpB
MSALLQGTRIITRPPSMGPSLTRRLRSDILGVPLLGKLLGANVVLTVMAFVGHELFPATSMALQIGIALVLSFIVSGLLAWLALRPIVELEATAAQVYEGDFSVRVPQSELADRDVQQLSTTMNRLLDRVESDRARIQYLAGRSVRARDIERESVARELRDSLAQTVSAVSLQVGAAQRVNKQPEVEQQLQRAQLLVQQLVEDMRGVAETLYPGTLTEFGLANAIRALVRRTSRRTLTDIEVDDTDFVASTALSPQATSALYRVADEGLRNIAQHASAQSARVILRSDEAGVVLEVEDDGRGLDLRSHDPMQAGLGLFSAKVVLALAGGDLQISSAPKAGTRVVARAPVGNPIVNK